MSAPDRDLAEQIAEVLDGHAQVATVQETCSCGWGSDVLIGSGTAMRSHRAHIAEQVAAVVQQREQQVEARALREFAARRDDMAHAWGGSMAWLTNGNNVADLVADWANEAAGEKENH